MKAPNTNTSIKNTFTYKTFTWDVDTFMYMSYASAEGASEFFVVEHYKT